MKKIENLAEKAIDVLKLLRQQRFAPSSTGQAITTDGRKTLVELLNAHRRQRRIITEIYLSNLSTYLNTPEKAPPKFVTELTNALGLADLGFDDSVWDLECPALIKAVRDALGGGVLTTVLGNQIWQPLFELHPARDQGFKLNGQSEDNRLFDVPEFTVVAGDRIGARGTMRFSGYMRVLGSLDSQYVGLNAYLQVPTHEIPHGRMDFGSGDTEPSSPRTVVYAFASRDPWVFSDWPVDHFQANRLSHGEFLAKVNRFYEIAEDRRAACVQSFVTTVPPLSGGEA